MTFPDFLKKNSAVLGVTMGIVFPAVLYLILFVVDQAVLQIFNQNLTRDHHYLYLLSTTMNLLPIRYYLVKLKFEKTGLGVLAITAVLILTYFFMYYNQ